MDKKISYERKGAVITDIRDPDLPPDQRPKEHFKSVNQAKKQSVALQKSGFHIRVIPYRTRVINKAQSTKTKVSFSPYEDRRTLTRKTKKIRGSVLEWELHNGITAR